MGRVHGHLLVSGFVLGMTTKTKEEKPDFHMMALAKSECAKNAGELTVVRLGYVTQLLEEVYATHHQELQKAYERGVEDQLDRESQNMDAVIAGMLQKAREEAYKAGQSDLIYCLGNSFSKGKHHIDEFLLEANYQAKRLQDQSELDQAPEKLPKAPESELDQPTV